MSYEILKHAADLKILVRAGTLEGLFSEALLAMAEILKISPPYEGGARGGQEVKRVVKISSTDSTSLLVDFLNEILSRSHINKEVYSNVVFKKLFETELEAEISVAKVDKFDEDIKAVTYHEAEIKKNRKGEFETFLVFDI